MSFFLAIGLSVVIMITTNAEYIIIEKLGKDMTLSGRTTIWEEIGHVNERPWFGYGYDGFWQFWRGIDNPAYSIKTDSGFVPHNSHNGFIEMWLTVGWVGLALFMYSFLTNIYNGVLYLIHNQEQESALPLLIFTWILIIAITEFFIMRIGTHWMFYVLMTTQLALAKR
jgi:O-antigen ligase